MKNGSPLVPKFDRVLLKRETLQQKAGTIFIPESAEKKERPARGVIVALGPTCGYLDDATREVVQDLTIGMKVIFAKNAGTEIEHGGEHYWLVADKDVLCEIAEE